MRSILSWLLASLVLLPMEASLPKVERALRAWNRLRSEHRTSPDADLDRTFEALGGVLPPSGLVGFHFVGPPDDGRTFFRLQYALSPRQLVRSVDHEFIIEVGPASNPESLTRQPRVVTATSEDGRLRVLRRIAP